MDSTIIAYSSGSPSLWGNGMVVARYFRTFSGRESNRGVSKRPKNKQMGMNHDWLSK